MITVVTHDGLLHNASTGGRQLFPSALLDLKSLTLHADLRDSVVAIVFALSDGLRSRDVYVRSRNLIVSSRTKMKNERKT
jgi:hypothetical protein